MIGHIISFSDGELNFVTPINTNNGIAFDELTVRPSPVYTRCIVATNGTTYANYSSQVPASGNIYKIRY